LTVVISIPFECEKMKLYYYRGSKPNFGDDLNPWMWPKLLPGLFDEKPDEMFLGIGSIIFDSHPKEPSKLVFGAGYGGYTPLPEIDDKWKFYFVRGLHTARAVGVDPSLALGDSAILLRSFVHARPAKTHKVSFMPHFESTVDGNWRAACALAGVHYIDPTGTVDEVLEAMLGSELLITEAMHGAIVADALRVPWVAVKPIQERHHMKWYDWASALDLELRPQELAPSSLVERGMKWAGNKAGLVERIRANRNLLQWFRRSAHTHDAAESLLQLSRTAPSMSTDTNIERAHSRMLEQVELLKRDRGLVAPVAATL
jgi:succinoglycan biosynthesis protein ExoV